MDMSERMNVALIKMDVGLMHTDVRDMKHHMALVTSELGALKTAIGAVPVDCAVLQNTSATQGELLAAKNSLVMWLVSLTVAGQLISGLLHRAGM